MSRFYDALRRAGQSFPFGQEEAGTEVSPSLEEARIEVEEILTGPEDLSLGQPDSPVAEEPFRRARDEKFAEPHSSRKNGHFGTSVQAAFNGKARVILNIRDSVVLEQYRLLRTKLLQLQQEKMFRSLVITSPGPQEGKTVTTLNLALTLGLLPGSKVLVVEGDMRKGSIREALRLGLPPGLSDLLEGSAKLEEAILKPETIPVSFIVRGNSPHAPGELLHSARLPALLQELTQEFDLVLIDSPPVNLVTDAQLLASCCDGVLLVARAFATSFKALQEATQALLPKQVIGTILNGGVKLSPYYGHRSYY